MAIPEFATYMNPIFLALNKLGGSARAKEVCSVIAEDQNIPDEVLDKVLKNGESRYENQVHWARFYLAETGYIDSSKRGVWALTEKGQNVRSLSEQEIKEVINTVNKKAKEKKSLETKGGRTASHSFNGGNTIASPPLDTFKQNTTDQLLSVLKSLSPSGFERVCQRLLREAGFEKVTVTGRTGDGGIDGYGVLQINPFVSFQVLFQCKRYEGSVSSSQIRDFRGAMMGRAEKGIIITTGNFTADAKREAMRDGVQPIELVDGEKLTQMFVQLELGVISRTIYEVDVDFFLAFKE